MTTAKLNKDKLKRMMEQKDAVSINLRKKCKGDSAPKSGVRRGSSLSFGDLGAYPYRLSSYYVS